MPNQLWQAKNSRKEVTLDGILTNRERYFLRKNPSFLDESNMNRFVENFDLKNLVLSLKDAEDEYEAKEILWNDKEKIALLQCYVWHDEIVKDASKNREIDWILWMGTFDKIQDKIIELKEEEAKEGKQERVDKFKTMSDEDWSNAILDVFRKMK